MAPRWWEKLVEGERGGVLSEGGECEWDMSAFEIPLKPIRCATI